MNIQYLFELVKLHDVQVTIIPSYKYPSGHEFESFKIIFTKNWKRSVQHITETELYGCNGEIIKLIFEKSIHELEEACKNDQT